MSELLKYTCPCCGGGIEFDSTIGHLKCPYCDTEFDADSLRVFDEDVKECEHDELKWGDSSRNDWSEEERQGMALYVCDSCGGEIIAEETTGSTRCPYCDSPVIIKRTFAGDLRPDLVIPFKLDKKAAKEAFKQHLCGKRLLPKVFKEENHIDEIKGIYVPFWIFDADALARVRYKATRRRTWSSRDFIFTETTYFSAFRAGKLAFSGIPADGSSKIPDDLMESIEPFDLSGAVDFQTAYLSGFLSDKYDVPASERQLRAAERMKESARNELKSTVVGYDSITTEDTSVKLDSVETKYVLYPVWLMNTTWRGERFLFAMNGQTGKFVGNLPTDKSAVRKYLLGIGAAATAAAYALSVLMFFM